MRLFEIAQEYKALDELANHEEFDQETGELIDNSEALTALFDELGGTLSDKLDNAAFVIKNIEFDISSVQGEADFLSKLLDEKKAKIKAKENKIKALKELMSIAVFASGQTKVESKFTFNRIVKQDNKLNIANENELPREYIKIKKEPDKVKIKKALKDGKVIDGCSLSDTVEFRIKG